MTQWRWQKDFPKFGLVNSYSAVKFGEPLQADGNLSYLEFIAAVKTLWEQSFPKYPIKPSASNDSAFTWYNPDAVDPITDEKIGAWERTDGVMVYSLELRKAHSVEPKPRMRHSYPKDKVVIYGQKFQNVVSFTAVTHVSSSYDENTNTMGGDQDSAYLADSLIEAFEDFMLEYTPVFKRLGAAELVYARRLSDTELERNSKDLHRRSVTYMLTTEKLYGAEVDNIEKIAIDVRSYMAVEQELLESATPDYSNIELNIIDLKQTATPNI